MRLLDAQFRDVPSVRTNVAATWARFGFQPTTEAERRARQSRMHHEETYQLEARSAPTAGADVRVPARGDGKFTRLQLAANR